MHIIHCVIALLYLMQVRSGPRSREFTNIHPPFIVEASKSDCLFFNDRMKKGAADLIIANAGVKETRGKHVVNTAPSERARKAASAMFKQTPLRRRALAGI